VIAASFLVYLIPEDTTMKIIVSDFGEYLDITKEKAMLGSVSIDESFEKLMEKKMSPNEYIGIAKVSSSQINSLIIELTDSGATQEWVESYVNYIGALKKLNEKITETIVVANLMNEINSIDCDEECIDSMDRRLNELIPKVYELKAESLDLIEKSNNFRP
jgi:hypothetical protein